MAGVLTPAHRTSERTLRAALDAFGTRGYGATSLDDLARDLGIRKQTILYWYPSKEALLDAAIDRVAAEVTVRLERAVASADEGSAKIVRSVVKLGQDLALEVVAEGVENGVMARALLDIGCDYGQGYGYAPALSPQEAEVYLNECYADGAAPVKARG